jgi:two-component system chemotaxis sensor kinase CheA
MSSEMDDVIHEYIAECQEMLDRLNERLSVVEKDPNQSEILRAIARDLHTIKGNSQLFGFLQVGQVAHAMEECLQNLKEAPSDVLPPLVDLILEGLDVIDQLFASIKATSKEHDLPAEVNAICQKLRDFLAKKTSKSQITRVPEPGENLNQTAVQEATQKIKQTIEEGPSDTIRVQIDILDNLMNLTGELVLIRNQLSQIAKTSGDDHLDRVSQKLQIISSELQTEVMKTRMQPIGNILGKFTRIVRDTARSVGKSAELNLSGSETELDKSLIEAVRDPLTHIVRNAVDHGIESLADRKKSGKPEQGTINIRAYHEGGHVNIEISDDGRGLSRMKIGSKAIERGLITPEALARMTDREIYNFIFYPGFSTASKVSNLSGRGVGMDVVRTNIEKIGGSIEIHSAAGKGTTIKLRIPLTLAIIPALIVKTGAQRFAIPQVNLAELIRVKIDTELHQIEMLQGQPVYRLRGHLLPILNLAQILSKGRLPETKSPDDREAKTSVSTNDNSVRIAILTSENRTFGLVVDEIEDSADIVVKPIPAFLKEINAYSGATILGDGAIALTIDVSGLAKLAGLTAREDQESLPREHISLQGDLRNQREEKISANHTEYLRVDIRSKGSYAIPLKAVSRLEEIASSEVQSAGDRKVVKYRGSLLPLVSIANALGINPDWPRLEKIPTVVVRENNRLYGLVVAGIVDIFSSESQLDCQIQHKDGLLGSIVDAGEVITMIDASRIIQRHFTEHLSEHLIHPQVIPQGSRNL